AAASKLRHHAARFHAASKHMAVIAIGGDDGVLRLLRRLHADHDRFLANIEMAKAADQPHAIKLARFFLKPADEQHVAIKAQEIGCLERLPLILNRPELRPGYEHIVLLNSGPRRTRPTLG